MRTITTVTNVYTIEELTGANFRTALESVARQREEDFGEFHSAELLKTLEKAAEYFGAEVTNYTIELFGNSYVTVDLDGLEDEDGRLLARSVNDNTEDGSMGSCPFTGHMYDCHFFDYFREKGPTNPRVVKRDIGKAIAYTLKQALHFEELSILSDRENEQYAKDMELEFLEDGTIFHG